MNGKNSIEVPPKMMISVEQILASMPWKFENLLWFKITLFRSGD